MFPYSHCVPHYLHAKRTCLEVVETRHYKRSGSYLTSHYYSESIPLADMGRHVSPLEVLIRLGGAMRKHRACANICICM